ncbi:Photosystem II PsbQ [Macleaya cordata]|uniref:Photosystem II PsbQ n=1 Tax=Macleaya cordata TaxID=56857 RepID=A0A200QML3_MACCD|nr:Photosystem II PsbQ [Macleaya cordata]
MARLSNLNGVVSETLLFKPNLFNVEKPNKRPSINPRLISSKKTEESQEQQPQFQKQTTTRRVLLGLAAVALSAQSGIENSVAEDNGFWLTGPLPIPPVYNKIANEETGTRSFLKKGVYMANIGPEGSAFRLRKYAFDLLALGDLIGHDAWNYVRQYLRLKSTFMYYDFDKVISAAPVDEKQPLTDLANKLFDNFEKLEAAVKKHSVPQTEAYYQDTTVLLQDIMNRFDAMA